MKTIALVSLVSLTGLLLVSTIQAAPSCCDPTQGQAQQGLFPIVPQAGSTAPVGPRNTYTQPITRTVRDVVQGPKNTKRSQPSTTYYPAPVAPIQTVFAVPQTNPIAAVSGPCGCGARSRTANYEVSKGSCCGGNASYGRAQVEQQIGSLPSCCSGKTQAAGPTPNCCSGKTQAAAPIPGCCAGQGRASAPTPSCCAGKVKAAAPTPSCCEVGPKTAAPELQVPKDTGKVSSSRLPLQPQPIVVQANVPSNMVSAMKVTSHGTPVLRFGSLW